MPPPAPNPQPVLPSPAQRWEIRLLGGCSACRGDVVLVHFPSRQVAMLLARLALFPQRGHSRQALAELLWPGAAAALARGRLRRALSALRRLLDAPGMPADALLRTDRDSVRLNADAFDCDALRFERYVLQHRHAEAFALYRGELLPGFYDDWVQQERLRFVALHDRLSDAQAPSPLNAEPDAFDRATTSATTLDVLPNLPVYFTAFFGREGAAQQLAEATAAHRLVTLSGPGGCGKTRLAVRTAAAASGFERIAFVALAECRDPSQVIDHLRAALQLPLGSGSALDRVAACLAGRRALVVLDNFEQLVGPPATELLTVLLARLPRLHLLVTSRRALQIEEEHELVLAPLPLPAPTETLLTASSNPGVALFIDRARARRGDFQIGPRNLAGLIGLCRALEGLPLALEIAASRVRSFSPQQMCDALALDLRMLARHGPRAAKDARHASLAATIDWSWRLLDPPQQHLLSALTVFRGGWTAQSAQSVAAMPECHDLLEALVADSLVQAKPDGRGGLRFAMLESVRQFVGQQIEPGDAAALHVRHRRHLLDAARRPEAGQPGIGDTDLPNITAALASALADGDPHIGASLALALKGYWLSDGAAPEVLDLVGRTIEALPAGDLQRGSLLCMTSRLLLQAGRAEEAAAAATSALAHCADDPLQRADALFTHTNVLWVWRRDGASVLEPAREALRQAEACASLDLQARASMLLAAITLWHLHQPREADRLFESAEGLFERLSDARGALSVFPGRVACLQNQGRHERAIELAHEGERRAADFQQVETQLLLHNRLSLSYQTLRRYDDACESCRRQARLARRHHMVYHAALALWNACHPMVHLRRAEAAAQLMGFSETYWVQHFGPIDADDGRHIERIRRLASALIGAPLWHELHASGAALTADEGFALLQA